jgi:hypothetical protein
LILPSADEIVQRLASWHVQVDKLRGHTETDHPEVDKEVPEIILEVKRVFEPEDGKIFYHVGYIEEQENLYN